LVVLGATLKCISLRFSFKKAAVALVIALGVTGLVAKYWVYMKARYEEASLEEEYFDESKQGRGYYLRLAHAIMEEHFLGIGLNNWSYWVSKRYGPREGYPYEDYDDLEYTPSKEIASSIQYAAPAHNLEALTVGELGVPGLVIFCLLWLRWFWIGKRFLRGRSPAPMHRLGIGICFGIAGIFLQSLFEWVYRQTPIFLTFNVLLGVLASLDHARRRAVQLPVRQPLSVPAGVAISAAAADLHPAGH
ncbi:MAG: O-antigen ligase family protein, partial [Verrucomicrobia bacterium]|nr:O-antigen ligase family protein [Verrucomicrobiota bacterium]